METSSEIVWKPVYAYQRRHFCRSIIQPIKKGENFWEADLNQVKMNNRKQRNSVLHGTQWSPASQSICEKICTCFLFPFNENGKGLSCVIYCTKNFLFDYWEVSVSGGSRHHIGSFQRTQKRATLIKAGKYRQQSLFKDDPLFLVNWFCFFILIDLVAHLSRDN